MKNQYLKPKLFSLFLFVVALVMIFGGFYIADVEGDMNFFGVAAIGIFLLITALTVFFVYRSYEKKLQRLLDSTPLLAFTLSPEMAQRAIEENSFNIKSNNKIVLITILAFCGLFAITGPFFVEDGMLFATICLGIAIFFTFVFFVTTAYRTHKLKTGDHEVILNEKGLYFMGQFYTFDMPGVWLSENEYASEEALLSLTITSATMAGPSDSKITIPIPLEYRAQVQEILDQLPR